MAKDYSDIINRTWEEVPEPEVLPGGDWRVAGRNVIFQLPREDADKEGSPKVVFFYKAAEPVGVAEDLLDAMGDYDFTINDLQYTIYIETAADWSKVRKHLKLLGIQVGNNIFVEGSQTKLAFGKAFATAEAVAELGQRSYENREGETVWQNTMSKFRPVEG